MSLKKEMQKSAALESELLKERAGALGRTGSILEAHLEQCQRLLEQLRMAKGRERTRLVREYRAARTEAETWRWYLTMQREAIGLRHHEDVDRQYPIPPVVRED
jgi:hypothetical protein